MANGISAAKLDEIETEAHETIEHAAEFALSSPEPDPTRVLEDVFYEGKEDAK